MGSYNCAETVFLYQRRSKRKDRKLGKPMGAFSFLQTQLPHVWGMQVHANRTHRWDTVESPGPTINLALNKMFERLTSLQLIVTTEMISILSDHLKSLGDSSLAEGVFDAKLKQQAQVNSKLLDRKPSFLLLAPGVQLKNRGKFNATRVKKWKKAIAQLLTQALPLMDDGLKVLRWFEENQNTLHHTQHSSKVLEELSKDRVRAIRDEFERYAC